MIRWQLFRHLNRTIAYLRGSVGWCMMAYRFARIYKGAYPLKAWWGAFLFRWRGLKE